MFSYNVDDLYDRCGVSKVQTDIKKPTFNGNYTEIDGETLPIINYNFQSDSIFSRNVCLKTFLGYIPIQNIDSFKDIFNRHKYCKDETEWSLPYQEEIATKEDKEQVKRLSKTLGNHWEK